MLSAYLSAEGATHLNQSVESVSFRGVFQRKITPLQNIARGSVTFAQHNSQTNISYLIRTDLLQIFVPAIILCAGLAMTVFANGSSPREGANVFTYFGAVTLVLSVSWAFVIYVWFGKWLRAKAGIIFQTRV